MASIISRLPIGATPGRLALVATLAVTLVVVVYVQIPSGETETPPHAARELASVNTKEPASRVSEGRAIDSKLSPAPIELKRLPDADTRERYTLEVALNHDPFEVPEAFQITPADSEEDLSEDITHPVTVDSSAPAEPASQGLSEVEEQAVHSLEQQGVSMVLRNRHEWIAVVGDQTVRVGDKLGVFRVVRIGTDGVIVEPTREDVH